MQESSKPKRVDELQQRVEALEAALADVRGLAEEQARRIQAVLAKLERMERAAAVIPALTQVEFRQAIADGARAFVTLDDCTHPMLTVRRGATMRAVDINLQVAEDLVRTGRLKVQVAQN